MRHQRLFLFLFFTTASFCCGADLVVNLRRDAQACAAAWNRRDFKMVVSYLPERLYPNGRARVEAVKEIEDGLSSAGDPAFHVSIGTIKKARKYRKLYAAIVPISATLDWPGLRTTDDSYLLAVSSNEGQSWQFLPLYEETQRDIDKFFPEFEGKILIPQSPAPATQIVIPD
ncbi:MAG TPA: hypothetical protein VFE25_13050 [Opitutaceae bacterium]|jgi:hypothetical protein|nr:hypothetical protein [Opitutaceae bacterium]